MEIQCGRREKGGEREIEKERGREEDGEGEGGSSNYHTVML